MIPKIIHYCWFGNNELPEKDKQCIESWKKHCPDYKIICWNESNYDISKYQYMKEAYEAKKWGFVPDIARLDIIYQNGGIYLDTDVEMVRNFDELLEYPAFMAFENDRMVNPGLVFGAEKENSIIGEILDTVYRKRSFFKEDGSYDMKPSPVMNTEFLIQKGLSPNGKTQLLPCNMKIYSKEYFCPMDYDTGELTITDNTYSIHHFHASWHTKEELAAHKLAQIFAKRFGKKIGNNVETIYLIPYRFQCKTKQYGLIGTLKIILRKIIKAHEE